MLEVIRAAVKLALRDVEVNTVDWDGAEGIWLSLLEIDPADGVSSLFLRRLAVMRNVDLNVDWDGSSSLD